MLNFDIVYVLYVQITSDQKRVGRKRVASGDIGRDRAVVS